MKLQVVKVKDLKEADKTKDLAEADRMKDLIMEAVRKLQVII